MPHNGWYKLSKRTTQTDEFDLITKNRNKMKSLIRKMSFAICTLLLTCTFCLAQTSNKAYTMVKQEIGNDSTKQKSVGIDSTFIRIMVTYETECYNDSTNIRVHKNEGEYKGWCFTYDGKECNAADHHKYIWIHKEPTFKDFVRWAAKKYGL